MKSSKNPARMGKKFWIFSVVAGLCTLGISITYFYHSDKQRMEERLENTMNYVKVQCSTYTHYNEASESKSLLRMIESTRQVSKNIALEIETGKLLNEELLENSTNQLWLSGVMVLDTNGNIVCEYSPDESISLEINSLVQQDNILNSAYEDEKVYSQQINHIDGSHVSFAACAREDEPGVVITYYLTPAEYAKNYTLTIQSLLNGYQNENDGTIIVADKGVIIASNDESMIGQSATENEAIQSLKQHDIHENMAHLTVDGTYSYGIMKKQSSRYIYIYVPEKVVFSALPQNVMATFLLYVIAISLMWLSLRKSKENSLRIEREKEQDYQRNLLEAAKKAEAANLAKTEFLQRMSHDIRTPINGIRGMVDVGDYYYDDLEKQSECRNKIREASNILLELVNEVLDMSKLESGEIFLEEKPFNIDEVIQEVCDVVDQLAKERKIQVDMDLGPIQHMNLVGSAMHLKRLLMNVLSNAVKYNKDHGSIHLSCRELPSDQMETAAFEFICEDSGIGMSEDFQKHIYEPFTQEKKGGASKFGGTGLGMPITKKLVEKMGGNITFESESGIGTTFTITIPFKINAEVEQCEDTQELSLHALDGFHILLVEDNELNMEIAEFSLQNAGAKITKAWNGQEAVEIFQASSIGDFDVILMDVMMPVMDGYEATKNIRSLSREDAKTIPIIAMTANAFSEDKIKAEEAGMNEHIAKPINMKLLLRIVSKLVNQS